MMSSIGNIMSLDMKPSCSSCKVSDIFTDKVSGDILCRNCGEVYASHLQDDTSEWRIYANDDRQKGDSAARANTQKQTIWSTQTFFEGGKEADRASLTKAQLLCEDPRRLNAIKNMHEVHRISTKLGVSPAMSEKACGLFAEAIMKDIGCKEKKVFIAAAAVYLACRIDGFARGIREVADTAEIEVSRLNKLQSIVASELKLDTRRIRGEALVARLVAPLVGRRDPVTDAPKSEIISPTCKRFLTEHARQVCSAIEHAEILEGVAPAYVAAVSIFLTVMAYRITRMPSTRLKAIQKSKKGSLMAPLSGGSSIVSDGEFDVLCVEECMARLTTQVNSSSSSLRKLFNRVSPSAASVLPAHYYNLNTEQLAAVSSFESLLTIEQQLVQEKMFMQRQQQQQEQQPGESRQDNSDAALLAGHDRMDNSRHAHHDMGSHLGKPPVSSAATAVAAAGEAAGYPKSAAATAAATAVHFQSAQEVRDWLMSVGGAKFKAEAQALSTRLIELVSAQAANSGPSSRLPSLCKLEGANPSLLASRSLSPTASSFSLFSSSSSLDSLSKSVKQPESVSPVSVSDCSTEFAETVIGAVIGADEASRGDQCTHKGEPTGEHLSTATQDAHLVQPTKPAHPDQAHLQICTDFNQVAWKTQPPDFSEESTTDSPSPSRSGMASILSTQSSRTGTAAAAAAAVAGRRRCLEITLSEDEALMFRPSFRAPASSTSGAQARSRTQSHAFTKGQREHGAAGVTDLRRRCSAVNNTPKDAGGSSAMQLQKLAVSSGQQTAMGPTGSKGFSAILAAPDFISRDLLGEEAAVHFRGAIKRRLLLESAEETDSACRVIIAASSRSSSSSSSSSSSVRTNVYAGPNGLIPVGTSRRLPKNLSVKTNSSATSKATVPSVKWMADSAENSHASEILAEAFESLDSPSCSEFGTVATAPAFAAAASAAASALAAAPALIRACASDLSVATAASNPANGSAKMNSAGRRTAATIQVDVVNEMSEAAIDGRNNEEDDDNNDEEEGSDEEGDDDAVACGAVTEEGEEVEGGAGGRCESRDRSHRKRKKHRKEKRSRDKGEEDGEQHRHSHNKHKHKKHKRDREHREDREGRSGHGEHKKKQPRTED